MHHVVDVVLVDDVSEVFVIHDVWTVGLDLVDPFAALDGPHALLVVEDWWGALALSDRLVAVDAHLYDVWVFGKW